jgi:cyclopropane fatty-acyl-phospholipid synthase-like methyltransferase
MKWLETSPKDYDRGIQLLTLGKIQRIKETIARDYVHAGTRVLEIGCGTGTLTLMMAQRGAIVTGIDASPRMLAEAEKKVKDANLEERVSLKYMDATLIGDRLPAASFDLIVSTLVFSELPPDDQRFVLEACQQLLMPNGRLLIADEVIPAKSITRLLYYLVRFPLVLLTWLVTRTTTHSLREFDSILTQTGFRTEEEAYLGGSLVLYESFPVQAGEIEPGLPPTVIGVMHHSVTLRTLLLDLWLLFFRIIPPYPKVRTGLYAVGHPSHRPSLAARP